MKLNLYSVYDLKVCAYSTPFFSPNDSVALRSYLQTRNDPNTSLYHFPGDFKLYRIGSFTDEDGLVQPEIPPALIQPPHKEE